MIIPVYAPHPNPVRTKQFRWYEILGYHLVNPSGRASGAIGSVVSVLHSAVLVRFPLQTKIITGFNTATLPLQDYGKPASGIRGKPKIANWLDASLYIPLYMISPLQR